MVSSMSLVLVVSLATLVVAGPMKLYQKTESENYRHVLVPVSSTVIPLDDLPQIKVGVGIGVKGVPPKGKVKPDGPIKLITIHSLKKNGKDKKDPSEALVEEVTQEEYKKLTQHQHQQQAQQHEEQ